MGTATILRLVLMTLGWLAAFATAAAAHPHIFIDASVAISFNARGEVTSIENSWTFDPAFSAWQTAELDVDGDGITSTPEMAELAAENIAGLAEYDFYTYAGEGSATLDLASAGDARFIHENGRSTFVFSLVPKVPYRIEEVFELAIYDPEYYVAIALADASAVTLANAPAGCTVEIKPPREMPPGLAERLYALPPEMLQLPPDLAAALRGVQGAIEVRCPAPGAATVDSAAAVAVAPAAAAPTTPFGGPPSEPGLTLPRTGWLGWIATQQQAFYRALTEALGQLRGDGNAFLVLGGLSFLYGVFHAAGPGHGKVVIASYVLANERLVRRGVLLSFAAALLQAAVAVLFVLVAALLLNATSLVMADAAHWIGIGSYVLVALLGLWLVGRKLFGWGHRHGPSPAGQAAALPHHHGDLHPHGPGAHEHGHAHVVLAERLHGDWREQLGVVLAVGARPCSGALVVLVFALSQGVLAAGIAAVFLMGLGTALTVAVLATLAVTAKRLTLRLAGGAGGVAAAVLWWGELAAALLVFGFGAVLLVASL